MSTQQVLPPAAFESVMGMGAAVRTFTQSRASKLATIVGCVVCIVIASAAGYYGAVYYPAAYPGVASTNMPYILGFAFVMLLIAAYLAWHLISHWNEAVVLYRDGFAHFNGKQVQQFRWSDITSLKLKVIKTTYYGIIPAGTQRVYTVQGSAGTIKLDGRLAQVDQLLDQVRDQAFPFIVARSKQAFDGGQSIQFGPLAVSKLQGIQKGKRVFPWADISGITIDNGIMEIKSKKGGLFGTISAAVMDIPNVDVFLAIASETTKRDGVAGVAGE